MDLTFLNYLKSFPDAPGVTINSETGVARAMRQGKGLVEVVDLENITQEEIEEQRQVRVQQLVQVTGIRRGNGAGWTAEATPIRTLIRKWTLRVRPPVL